jgi:hypothetical protein
LGDGIYHPLILAVDWVYRRTAAVVSRPSQVIDGLRIEKPLMPKRDKTQECEVSHLLYYHLGVPEDHL